MKTLQREIEIRLKRPHSEQKRFIDSDAKRKVIRAGRRSGKTTGIAIYAIQRFLGGSRVLYTAPTQDQVSRFWHEVKTALTPAIDAGVMYKNETEHIIGIANKEQRIRAKTAWNADMIRGDYADLLIFDEWQLTNEEAWEFVGAPMLLDNDGEAVFIYTPPSLSSRSVSKANDKRHAAKLFARSEKDETGRWEAFHFTSRANPHISQAALEEITRDMSARAIRQEIEAEDIEEVPGALWTQALIDATRVDTAPECDYVVIGVDPPGGATECGIVVVGKVREDAYVLADYSMRGTPAMWANKVLDAYIEWNANLIVAEKNYGGDMVREVLQGAQRARDINAPVWLVNATRGKAVRAEPVQARYERGFVHHVGTYVQLEDEMTSYVPGQTTDSPNRMDALVWAVTSLRREVAFA
jgi:hypothetical protein